VLPTMLISISIICSFSYNKFSLTTSWSHLIWTEIMSLQVNYYSFVKQWMAVFLKYSFRVYWRSVYPQWSDIVIQNCYEFYCWEYIWTLCNNKILLLIRTFFHKETIFIMCLYLDYHGQITAGTLLDRMHYKDTCEISGSHGSECEV
jgi:hypothetical protein